MSMKRRQQHKPSAPMLVMRGLINDRLETRERMAVEAFAGGWAGFEHFDTVADMQGVLILAGSTSDERRPAMIYAKETLGPVLATLRDKLSRTGKADCSADELKVLRGFVSMYRDFWMRQPLSLYEAACDALQRTYKEMASAKKEAA